MSESPSRRAITAAEFEPLCSLSKAVMTVSSPLDELSATSYVVEEPSSEHGDADSQLSPSVDTDTPVTRYTMAEMEAYIQLVRKDR